MAAKRGEQAGPVAAADAVAKVTAAFRLQRWWREARAGPTVDLRRTHARVMKAALGFKALAERQKGEAEAAALEVTRD